MRGYILKTPGFKGGAFVSSSQRGVGWGWGGGRGRGEGEGGRGRGGGCWFQYPPARLLMSFKTRIITGKMNNSAFWYKHGKHTHTHTHTHTHAHTHAHTHTYTHTHTRTHARTHARTHTHIHTDVIFFFQFLLLQFSNSVLCLSRWVETLSTSPLSVYQTSAVTFHVFTLNLSVSVTTYSQIIDD